MNFIAYVSLFRYQMSFEVVLLIFSTMFIKWSHLLLYSCIVRENFHGPSLYNSVPSVPPHSHLLATLRNATCWGGIGRDSKSFLSDNLTIFPVFVFSQAQSFLA